MNTIPLTFNEHQISRTVLGGKENPESTMNISVILINKIGSQFKTQVFEELLKCNFASFLVIEPDTKNYNIDEVSRRYPKIKFIIPHESVSDGELINIAMAEIKTDFALVLKDGLYIPTGVLMPHLAEKLIQGDFLCLAPRLVDYNKNSLPIQKSPSSEKQHFVLDSQTTVRDGMNTIFPFDYIGLYNRQRFIEVGGFDYTIKSPYWQLLDFGVRSWLWGEKIKITTALQLSYTKENVPPEDSTPSLESLRFYLKNQLPKYKEDSVSIKKSSFWRFFRHSHCGYFEARRQFKDAVSWVDMNKFRYQMDLQSLIENWN